MILKIARVKTLHFKAHIDLEDISLSEADEFKDYLMEHNGTSYVTLWMKLINVVIRVLSRLKYVYREGVNIEYRIVCCYHSITDFIIL